MQILSKQRFTQRRCFWLLYFGFKSLTLSLPDVGCYRNVCALKLISTFLLHKAAMLPCVGYLIIFCLKNLGILVTYTPGSFNLRQKFEKQV